MPKIRQRKKVTIPDCRVNGIYTPEECANKVAVPVDGLILLVDKTKLEAIGKDAYIEQWRARRNNQY